MQQAEEAFVRACVDSEHPAFTLAARYLSAARLHKLAAAVVATAEPPLRNVGPRVLVRTLLEAGIIVPICQGNLPEPRVFWLTIRGGHRQHHHPLEVLCAAHSETVISHHTAFAHHGLTVARPLAYDASVPSTAHARGLTLGELDDLPLMIHRVVPRLLFGIQQVWTDSAEHIAVFDLERSLIGALDQTDLFGGAQEVMAAWAAAAEVLRLSVVAEYLQLWNSPILWRRTGAMAQRFALSSLAAICTNQCDKMTDLQMSQNLLLRGASGRKLLQPWNLLEPWT